MTELSASAGSEGYAACDDEAKDMQLARTKRRICSLRRRRGRVCLACALRLYASSLPKRESASHGAYFVLYAVPSMMRKGLKAVTSVTVPSASVSVYFTP